jgi:hypothetical protein
MCVYERVREGERNEGCKKEEEERGRETDTFKSTLKRQTHKEASHRHTQTHLQPGYDQHSCNNKKNQINKEVY